MARQERQSKRKNKQEKIKEFCSRISEEYSKYGTILSTEFNDGDNMPAISLEYVINGMSGYLQIYCSDNGVDEIIFVFKMEENAFTEIELLRLLNALNGTIHYTSFFHSEGVFFICCTRFFAFESYDADIVEEDIRVLTLAIGKYEQLLEKTAKPEQKRNVKVNNVADMMHRQISEDVTAYINEMQKEAGVEGFDYRTISDKEAEKFRKKVTADKGYFVLPSELYCNMKKKNK